MAHTHTHTHTHMLNTITATKKRAEHSHTRTLKHFLFHFSCFIHEATKQNVSPQLVNNGPKHFHFALSTLHFANSHLYSAMRVDCPFTPYCLVYVPKHHSLDYIESCTAFQELFKLHPQTRLHTQTHLHRNAVHKHTAAKA